MREQNGRHYLFTQIPINYRLNMIVWTTFLIGAYIFAKICGPTNNTGYLASDLDRFFFYIMGMAVPLFSLLAWSSRSYKLSYNSDALYLSIPFWKWDKLRYVWDETAMHYDSIDELMTTPGRANIRPFEYVLLRRKGGEWEENFFVSRIYCRDNEIRQLLEFLYTKCGEKFPPELVDFMNAEES
jgi:hypothetical protein